MCIEALYGQHPLAVEWPPTQVLESKANEFCVGSRARGLVVVKRF